MRPGSQTVSPTDQSLFSYAKRAYKTIYQDLVIKQSMPASGKVLEDSIRLSRIRKIKLTLYIVQAVMLVALGVILIFFVGGAKVKPTLYLPLDSFLAVLVLLLLIICLESFFFRILEIRFARSTSARHLMAKNSIKRSIVFAIIAGVFVIILGVPAVLQGLENTGERTVVMLQSSEPVSFYSSDPFNLAKTDEVMVSSARTVDIYLVSDDVYNQYRGAADFLSLMYSFRLNRNPAEYVVDDEITIEIPNVGFMKYRLVLNDYENPNTSATVVIPREASGTFTGTVSLLLIAFVVANAAWIAYLIPIERKYAVGSIYK